MIEVTLFQRAFLQGQLNRSLKAVRSTATEVYIPFQPSPNTLWRARRSAMKRLEHIGTPPVMLRQIRGLIQI